MENIKFFKPTDFGQGSCATLKLELYYDNPYEVANKANALLQERGVRVTGTWDNGRHICTVPFGAILGATDTHQALLVCIEEIEKKDCVHEPESYFDSRFGVYYGTPKCKHCGLLLTPKWEVAE